MAQIRRAEGRWQGDLLAGDGDVSAATSVVFSGLPITWRARTEGSDGMTSPEELLAAAHAACFAMASSNELAKAGFPPTAMDVAVEVTADKTDAGWTVLASRISLRGRATGIDEATFQKAAEAARSGCPISRALSHDVEVTLDATLLS